LPGQTGPAVIGINLRGAAAIPVLMGLVTGYMVRNAPFDRLVQRDLGSPGRPIAGGTAFGAARSMTG